MSMHALLAPSAAHRWLACPGSARLAARYPDRAGPDARRGTFAHTVADTCLKVGSTAKDRVYDRSSDGEFVVDAEMMDAVQVYVDAVRSIELLDGPGTVTLTEQKVRLLGAMGEHVHGTADALVWAPERQHLHVLDFKFGAGVFVDAVDNPQLDIYAVGALVSNLWPGLRDPRTIVTTHIVQPRCTGADPWRSAPPRKAVDLLRWADEVLVPAAERALADGAELVPGESQCRWCPAAVDCPARRQQLHAVATELFQPAGIVSPAAALETKAPPNIAQLGAPDLARIMAMAPRVREYLDAVEGRAYDLAMSGTTVPGYKLVERSGTRKWTDEEKAVAMLRAAGVDPYDEPSVVSPAQAEKRLGKARASLVAPLAHKPVTGASLVPETDKRPSITTAVDMLRNGLNP